MHPVSPAAPDWFTVSLIETVIPAALARTEALLRYTAHGQKVHAEGLEALPDGEWDISGE